MEHYQFRLLTDEDEPIIWQMLRLAAQESSVQSLIDHPQLARYANNWGNLGDLGWVAIATATQQPIGATWMRLWLGGDRGFGYVSDTIPELAIAVLPEHQGQGVGTQLLTRLLETAQLQYSAISLSVRSNNRALQLYERLGFIRVKNSQHPNRTGGQSFTMICQFTTSGFSTNRYSNTEEG